jgi:hypothetical protein
MKKLIYGTLFLGLIGFGIIGCEKEVNGSKNSQSESKEELRESLIFKSSQEQGEQNFEKLRIRIFTVSLARASQ